MLCRLTHVTRYDYRRPVFLEPHLIRLTPRGDAVQRLLFLDIAVDPPPVGRAFVTDASGNAALSVWFGGETRNLCLTSRAVVETLRDNPFDYLIDFRYARLPVPLSGEEAAILAPCLAVAGEACPGLAAAVRQVREAGAVTPQDFALGLLGWMQDRIRTVSRDEPGILSPDDLLARGEGACRDLAAFFVTACRLAGIPARFVSGYHEGDPEKDERDLHAWVEAYLPGGGWRGFDPSLGLAVADRHVVVAAAPEPAGAAPVVGTFRGDGGDCRLSHDIRLEMAPAPQARFFSWES